ncbi:cyclin2 related protein [Cardiosporidium cionae]|uniref:Cyclin2 related protein n=1 Tax=Cardiosporidium cionae TaxID=476202 RepID=A0ABQ7J4A6_9APIC|nr:cyclin2 related protein [Cardiosporidium cionae]|eukprot:KAF8817947.1 cyclin2 related protein [Cardiosporidium cionae]
MSALLYSLDGEPKYIASPTEDSFIPSLATVLTHLVSLTPTDSEVACSGGITRFHGVVPPSITIRDYLTRIAKYFRCSNECFVLSLVYIDRIVKLHDGFAVSILNIHRLLVTSVMLAAKFFDDVYYSNAFYARVGGVGTREMNLLEAHFLSLINYQLFVSPEEYDQYRQNVLEAVRAASAIRGLSPSLRLLLAQESPEEKINVSNASRSRANTRKFQPSVKHATSPKVNSETSRQHPCNDSFPVCAVDASRYCPILKSYSHTLTKADASIHMLSNAKRSTDYETVVCDMSMQMRRKEETPISNKQCARETEMSGVMNEMGVSTMKRDIYNGDYGHGAYHVRLPSIEEKESEFMDANGCTIAYGTVNAHRAGSNLVENDLSIQDSAGAQLYSTRAF